MHNLWLCNANDTTQNSRAPFRSRATKNTRKDVAFSRSVARRWGEVIGTSPFASRNTETWKEESTRARAIRIEPPRVSCNRGKANEHSPRESFVRTFLFRGELKESPLDSQIAFQEESNGLSVIDRRANRRSVQLEERERISLPKKN